MSIQAIETHGTPALRALPRTAPLELALILLVAIAYATILTTARFDFFVPKDYGLVFNSMLEHMLAGRFDVDPAVVGNEGYVHAGRTYAYWGVFCAALRLPLTLIPRGMTIDVTVLSCWFAASLAAAVKIHAAFWLHRARNVPVLLTACLLLQFTAAGPLVANLQPSIYSEPIFWAYALATIFVLATAQALITGQVTTARLALIATCAGLCFLARSSTGTGLYAALAVLLLARIPAAWRRRDAAIVIVPGLIALSALLISFWVNTGRWGSPFVGQDLSGYLFLHKDPHGIDVLADHGMFSPARIPLALQYYFLPLGPVLGQGSEVLAGTQVHDLYYIAELPPSSLLATDLLPLILGLLLLRELLRPAPPLPRWTTLGVTTTLLAPAIVVMLYWAIANRYRLEFAPALDAVAILAAAIPAIQRRLTATPLRAALLIAATSIGVGASLLTLFLQRLSFFGDAQSQVQVTLRAYYQSRYRNIANTLGIELPFSRQR